MVIYYLSDRFIKAILQCQIFTSHGKFNSQLKKRDTNVENKTINIILILVPWIFWLRPLMPTATRIPPHTNWRIWVTTTIIGVVTIHAPHIMVIIIFDALIISFNQEMFWLWLSRNIAHWGEEHTDCQNQDCYFQTAHIPSVT